MQPPVQRIDVGAVALEADLSLPERARGLVVFAHASGSARRRPCGSYSTAPGASGAW